MFIDFSRLDANNDMNPQGTGLGLSICKRIIEEMGGDVEVKSQVGVGTSFIVTVFSTMIADQELYSKVFGQQKMANELLKSK